MTPEEETRIRAEERERIAEEIKEFSWALPLHEDAEINEATDDAACAVQEQILEALRSGTDTDYVCVRREILNDLLEDVSIVSWEPGDVSSFRVTLLCETRGQVKRVASAISRLRSLLKEKE